MSQIETEDIKKTMKITACVQMNGCSKILKI